jgi:hypothetical protein
MSYDVRAREPGGGSPEFVQLTRDRMRGQWRLHCVVCGNLGMWRDFWQASRLKQTHEDAHDTR